jgi:hypothetical protein
MHRGPEATMAQEVGGNGGGSRGLLSQMRDMLKG